MTMGLHAMMALGVADVLRLLLAAAILAAMVVLIRKKFFTG